MAAGKTAQLAVGYRSQGLNEWRYSFGGQDVDAGSRLHPQDETNFKDIDFPDNTFPLRKNLRQTMAGI